MKSRRDQQEPECGRNMSLRSVKATSVCRSTFNGTVQAQRGRYHFCFLQKLPIFFFGNSLSQKKHVLVERRESLPLTWMNGWKRSFNCGLIQTRHLTRRSQPIKTITREIKLRRQWRGQWFEVKLCELWLNCLRNEKRIENWYQTPKCFNFLNFKAFWRLFRSFTRFYPLPTHLRPWNFNDTRKENVFDFSLQTNDNYAYDKLFTI